MKTNKRTTVLSSFLISAALITSPLVQAVSPAATKAVGEAEMLKRYEHAASLIRGEMADVVSKNDNIIPYWIGDSDQFIYLHEIAVNKKEFRLVNAAKRTNKPAFNHKALAKMLSQKLDKELKGGELYRWLTDFDIDTKTGLIHFRTGVISFQSSKEARRWVFNARKGHLKEVAVKKYPAGLMADYEDMNESPDGRQAVFTKDYNLWVKDLVTGKERALTTDGIKDYAYSGFLPARWSPDGKTLYTAQVDSRQVEVYHRINFVPADRFKPKVSKHKIPGPKDQNIYTIRLMAIDVETGKIVDAKYPSFPLRDVNARSLTGEFFFSNLGWWGKGSRLAYFIHIDQYHKKMKIMEFDTKTGATRQLFEETSDTWVRLTDGGEDSPLFIPLPETDELLWWSQRSGHGHIYLYDMKTGKLKNTVTQGDWQVRSTVQYDAERRELFLQTGGRVKGINPYYRDLVRVNIDTGKMVIMANSDHHYTAHSLSSHETNGMNIAQMFSEPDLKDPDMIAHKMVVPYLVTAYNIEELDGSSIISGVSPTGNYAVVTRSRVNSLPETYLMDRNGKKLMDIEKAEISVSRGWQWPEPVKMKSADGKTDMYGVIYRPSGFSPDKSYPVINHVQNEHQYHVSPKGSFNDVAHPAMFFDAVALAELGFIVVQVDGRGTTYRGKAFEDYSYGRPDKINDLVDHVAGIKQLGKRYSYMDMDRVGIVSLYLGTGAARGVLTYPDFYKVGVEGGMSYDVRQTRHGYLAKHDGPDGPLPGYKHLEELAGNLKGKLLIMTQPYYLAQHLRLVDALEVANKDYDLMMRKGSIYANRYHMRRAWDYLVRHLQGNKPPKGFKLKDIGGF